MNKALEIFKKAIGKEAKDAGISPFGMWLNGKLIEVGEGNITLEYKVRQEFTNPSGMIHGGIYAGIMDEVIGMAVYTLGQDSFYAAVNLNVDFLRPSTVEEVLTVKSQVVRAGKTLAHVDCQIFGSDGKLKAKATSNLTKTSFGFK